MKLRSKCIICFRQDGLLRDRSFKAHMANQEMQSFEWPLLFDSRHPTEVQVRQEVFYHVECFITFTGLFCLVMIPSLALQWFPRDQLETFTWSMSWYLWKRYVPSLRYELFLLHLQRYPAIVFCTSSWSTHAINTEKAYRYREMGTKMCHIRRWSCHCTKLSHIILFTLPELVLSSQFLHILYLNKNWTIYHKPTSHNMHTAVTKNFKSPSFLREIFQTKSLPIVSVCVLNCHFLGMEQRAVLTCKSQSCVHFWTLVMEFVILILIHFPSTMWVH